MCEIEGNICKKTKNDKKCNIRIFLYKYIKYEKVKLINKKIYKIVYKKQDNLV